MLHIPAKRNYFTAATQHKVPAKHQEECLLYRCPRPLYRATSVHAASVSYASHDVVPYPAVPTGYLPSSTKDWLAPTIAPEPNPAHVVQLAAPNRSWDVLFPSYGGGIGGTCAIYDPPFSYWCQDKKSFGSGCGGCFTWNIPSGLRVGKDVVKAQYKNVEDGLMLAWRAAHCKPALHWLEPPFTACAAGSHLTSGDSPLPDDAHEKGPTGYLSSSPWPTTPFTSEGRLPRRPRRPWKRLVHHELPGRT